MFPHKYGGDGWLLQIVRWFSHRADDVKSMLFSPKPPFDQLLATDAPIESDSDDTGPPKPKRGEKSEWRP